MRKAFFIAFVVCSFVCSFVCSCAFQANAQTRTSVRVDAETKVESNLLTLGDVARVSGDDEKSRRLRAVALGYAPNVGATREIGKEKIALAIAAAGFAASEITLDAPPIVRVRRAGQEISRDRMREAVEKSVLSQLLADEIEARIVRLDLPEKLDVPVGALEIRVSTASVRNLFAPFAAALEIRVNDAVVRRLSANIEIEAFADILVAAKDLTTDAKIAESDFRFEKRRLEKPLQNYLRGADKLRGAKLIKNLSSGAELTTDYFVAGVVIRAGDAVRIVGQSGALQISVAGEARTNGKIGDRIAVKNSQSNAVIQAIVVDEGLVKVFF